MGDVAAEPSMEDILSSIKRIIAEEGEPGSAPPRPRRPRVAAAERLQPPVAADDEILELSERVPSDETETQAPAETILSTRAAQASRGSLEALSKMVVKPETSGSDTLEGMVREMLRPMLRDWLDAQLPGMVEQMVAREIARITGSAS
ncbi:pole-organizing protein PopZ [soil metagenome]